MTDSTGLPGSITSLQLLANAEAADNQRVTGPAAAAPNNNLPNSLSLNDDYLKTITYQSVSSVAKQCEFNRSSSNLNASSGTSDARRDGHIRSSKAKCWKPFSQLPKSDQERIMIRNLCSTCGKYAHWRNQYLLYGSLPPGIKSVDGANTGSKVKLNDSKSTLKFIVAQVSEMNWQYSGVSNDTHSGPLVDDGAPYSAIGLAELQVLLSHVGINLQDSLQSTLTELDGYTHWRHGPGKHSGTRRRIIEYSFITLLPDTGRIIYVCYVFLERSSQWALGKYIASKVDIEHVCRLAMTFLVGGIVDFTSLINYERLN